MNDVEKLLRDAGAVLDGHFIGTSGKHLSGYVNKDAFLPDTAVVSAICRKFAELNADKEIEAVVAPALGGLPLSQWTAHHLTAITGKKVLSLFTEKDSVGVQVFKRGYNKLVKGKRVLVVEDTVATGGSVKTVIDKVIEAGGNVIQLSLIVNRDPERITSDIFGVPMNALVDIPMRSFTEEEVPDWLKVIPIRTDVGHGAKYIKEHPDALHT